MSNHQEGNVRVASETSSDGQGFLRFLDKGGERRVTVGTFPDGTAGQVVRDKDGKVWIINSTNADGSVVLEADK
ncbi:hypothetical protein [Paludisphaera rhizosphaerae]|uniref:hypothetical protein n=1 Tax=Paludisphaera rhizosphaerae TaxID=2711216 RepID=UPI0013EAAC77|nr:hypothetical protein [Paludisphaera rhizosphaerae]